MDKLALFKLGGKVIDNPSSLEVFLKRFAAIEEPKILVHGGGVIADQMAKRLDIVTTMHEGRRITSKPMLDLATMVYGGQINKTLVADLQRFGCDAVGFTGADAGLIRSKRRSPEPIDFGYVGDVTHVRTDMLVKLLGLGLTPIFAPLSYAEEILNTNADSIASALARGLAAHYEVHLLYCFEQPGVMLDLKDADSLIRVLDRRAYQAMLDGNLITAGMLPKLQECFRALEAGVSVIVLAEAGACLDHAEGREFVGTKILS